MRPHKKILNNFRFGYNSRKEQSSTETTFPAILKICGNNYKTIMKYNPNIVYSNTIWVIVIFKILYVNQKSRSKYYWQL